jgi:hypothetical protein
MQVEADFRPLIVSVKYLSGSLVMDFCSDNFRIFIVLSRKLLVLSFDLSIYDTDFYYSRKAMPE